MEIINSFEKTKKVGLPVLLENGQQDQSQQGFSPSLHLENQDGVKLDAPTADPAPATDPAQAAPPVAASADAPTADPAPAAPPVAAAAPPAATDPAPAAAPVLHAAPTAAAPQPAENPNLVARRSVVMQAMLSHSDKLSKQEFSSLMVELSTSGDPDAVYRKFTNIALSAQIAETASQVGGAIEVGKDNRAARVIEQTCGNLLHYSNLKNGASPAKSKQIAELMAADYNVKLSNNELHREHKSLDSAFRFYQTQMYGKPNYGVELQQDSQFVDATRNVLNKMLRMSYKEKNMRYAMITRDRMVDDFKEVRDYQGGGVFPLQEVGAQGQLQQVKLDTESSTGQAEQRGAQVDLLRKDLINDDIGILSRVPEALGRSTRHHDENLCASLLLQNRMQLGTSNKIFSAGNSNISGASGALVAASDNGNMKVLNRETLRLMAKNLADQKFGDQFLYLGVDYLIGGTQYQAAFQQLFEMFSSQTVANTNAFAGALKGYIVDPRLNAAGDIFWGASSDIETFKMLRVANRGFGEGYFGPQLIVPNTERLSLCFQLVYDVGAYIVDYRGLSIASASEPSQFGSLVA